MALENNIALGIHYSRFVASWTKTCRKARIPVVFSGRFKDWLRSLGLDEQTVSDIYNMADCGKLELESSAYKFIKTHEDLRTFEEKHRFYEAGLITREELKAALK